MSAVQPDASEYCIGVVPPPRHIDHATRELAMLTRSWREARKIRIAFKQRGLPAEMVEAFGKIEQRLGRLQAKALRSHTMWPWVSQFPGLRGAHTALLLAEIADPRRFPGQKCSKGHYLPVPPGYEIGSPCPIVGKSSESEQSNGDGAEFPGTDESSTESDAYSVCPGVMLPPRPGTGSRAVWHWGGLIPDENGRQVRKRKGVKCDWVPFVQSLFLQPDGGICAQIARHVPKGGVEGCPSCKGRPCMTFEIYGRQLVAEKARLPLRVVGASTEGERTIGDAIPLRAADVPVEIGGTHGRPLRPMTPGRALHTASLIAGKAFLADLLAHWKTLVDPHEERR